MAVSMTVQGLDVITQVSQFLLLVYTSTLLSLVLLEVLSTA